MKIDSCRSCGFSNLRPIISLGEQYVSNFVTHEQEMESIPKVPLNLVLCDKCKLLQLEHNAPPESMWGEQYWYKSGINKIIREDLKDIADSSEKIVSLSSGDLVVDIGCNDGTLLSFYDKEGLNLVGFEPSGNVAREAVGRGFSVINNFFNAEDFKKNFGDKKAKLITAISMFYDLENPNKFMEDIVSVLDKDGVFVIQQNYLVTMLERNGFDNICHEHREYYSIISLKNLVEKYGLEIFDIKQNEINGGSIRTYLRFRGNAKLTPFKGAVQRILDLERKEINMGIDTPKPYEEFASRIMGLKEHILKFIEVERSRGKTFALCGASTRGNVILQYFNLTSDQMIAAAEANPDKYGKKIVGSLIPIVSIEEMKKINPDYQLVLIWHLFDGLMDKEKEYLKIGGKFILPLPEFKIIEYWPEFDKLVQKKFL